MRRLPVVILIIAVMILLASTQRVNAVGGTVNGSTCGSTFGGTWNGVDTCTITNEITVSSGQTLTIPAGVNLVLSNSAGVGIGVLISQGGTLTNFGTLTVANSGSSNGLWNDGTLTNLGTLTVANTGTGYIGIYNNLGSIPNLGTLIVANTGANSAGIYNVGGTISNVGSVTVSNTAGTSYGILNDRNLSNSGIITVSDSGLSGIYNRAGTFANNAGGAITISDSGSYGIYNAAMLTANAGGTIAVSNTGLFGILNGGGTFSNSGTLTVSNTGTYGIYNEATLQNYGTVTVSNTRVPSYGIYNFATLTNNAGGTITVLTTDFGIYNYNGAYLTNDGGGTIIISNSEGIAVYNLGTLSNFGAVTLSNSDIINSNTYSYGIDNGGTLTNYSGGTILVSNTGTTSFGIANYVTLSNSGTIIVCAGTTYGTIPTSGNPLTACVTTITPQSVNDATGQAPTGSELAGASFHDTAVVTVAAPYGSSIPSGTVEYHFFTTGDCSGAFTDQQVTLNSDGTVPSSLSTGPLAGGSYSYTADYSGRGRFADSISSCEPFTVIDAPPTVSITGLPVSLEATSPGGAVATYTASAISFTGASLSTTCSPLSGSTFPLGVTTVICSAKDEFGITGSTSSTVTVVDTTPPILTLPASITAEATSPSGAFVTYSASAIDLVDGPLAVSCSPASGSTFALGTTTVNCSATDAHHNTSSGSFTITVQDITPPVLTISPNIVAEATGPSGATVSYTVSAMDIVDGSVTPSCSPGSSSTFPLGTTTVTCTATDAHSNTAGGSFAITVQDTTPPNLVLPADITASAAGPSGAVVTYSTSATDLVDGTVAVNCSPGSGSTFPVFMSTLVTCSASDSHGNTVTGSFHVTVRDTTPPVLVIPSSITAEATGPNGAIVSYTVTASDDVDPNPSVACNPQSGTTFPLGATTVPCTATDSSGNKSSASFVVSVVDTTPPVVTITGLPAIYEATGPSGATATFSASATDTVSGTLTPTCSSSSGSIFPLGTTTITCTATDAALNTGSATSTVTVQDTTPPSLNLPGAITVEATSPAGAFVTYSASATDLVDGSVAVTCTPASGSVFPVFHSTSVTCASIDAHGNTATDSFSVTVVDTTPPVLTVPAPITIEGTGPNGAVVTFKVTTTDIVDPNPTIVCSSQSGSTYPLGSTLIQCSATDSSGNKASASFSVTVVDTTPPVLTLPADITTSATGPSGAVVIYTASSTDLIDGPVPVTCSPASGSTYPVFATTLVTCSATDSYGNRANGSFHITVIDNTPPVLTIPLPITAEATGPTGASVSFSVAATDTVDPSPSVTCSAVSGSTFALGTTPVSCTATDFSGNSSHGTFTVKVQDTTPPSIVAPASIVAEATGPSGRLVSFSLPLVSDLVDPSPTVSCLPVSGSTFSIGTTVVSCSATDFSGNKAAATFTVTIVDTTPPMVSFSGLPATLEATGPGGATATFSASAMDIVSGTLLPTCSQPSGSTFPLGTTVVKCTATDAAGNVGLASSTVTVRDTTPPLVSISGLPVGLEATGPAGAVATFSATAMDIVSGSLPTTCSPASGSAFSLGTTTVTCTATDAAGNLGSSSSTVTVRLVDFAIAASPANINPPAGILSGSSTIMVNGVNGFTGTVSLTVTSTAGLTCSTIPVIVSLNSTSPFGSTVLSCWATASGTYTALVNGTSLGFLNEVSRHTRVTFTFIAQTIKISASPNFFTGNSQNGKSQFTSVITIISQGSFAGTVTLTATGSPSSKVSLTFSTTTLTLISGGTASAQLFISIGPNASPGTYTIAVTGTSGTTSKSTTIIVVIPSKDVKVPAITWTHTLSVSASGGIQTWIVSVQNKVSTPEYVQVVITGINTGGTHPFSAQSIVTLLPASSTVNITVQAASGTFTAADIGLTFSFQARVYFGTSSGNLSSISQDMPTGSFTTVA